MELNEEQLPDNQDDVRQNNNDNKPNAYRVDDDGNPDEASLRKNYGIGGEMKNANAPGMEGQGMGGHKFGGTSQPPTGDDPANPSRNAGYSNGYFSRTAPSDENTEHNNFKSADQEGEPNYQTSKSEMPDKNASDQQHQSQTHAGDAPEIPGPSELPQQQKVGGA